MYDIPLHRHRRALRLHQHDTTAPYRGAGRPEANYMLERVIDEAARVSGIDRDQAAPAQPDQALGHAVQDRGRHHHRQR